MFSTWPTVAYNPKSSEDRKHTMRSQKSQLYCTFIINLFVERGTFSMKVLLPVQERWCEIQNRRCKHVGNSFTLLSVPSSIRWVTPPASISQLTSKSLKESLPLLQFTQYSGTGSLPCTQTNTFAIKILIPPVNVQQLMRVFLQHIKVSVLKSFKLYI